MITSPQRGFTTQVNSYYQVGQNLYQSFSSAETNQDGLDAAIDATVQVNMIIVAEYKSLDWW